MCWLSFVVCFVADNSDIFLNETTFNVSGPISSATSLKPSATATPPFADFLTPTAAPRSSTASRREGAPAASLPKEKLSSDSSMIIIPRSEAPALLPRLTIPSLVEDSLDEEDDFDVSGGSPKTDGEGSSDYERTTSSTRGGTTRSPPQGKGGRLTNIYDSDKYPSSSQSDTDFQFALIYNGGGETGLPRQRHQQHQKNLPTLYDYDENQPDGQQHPGLAASQSPYSPGNPQLPDRASSQPRSSPNRSSSSVQFCRLSSVVWTTALLASIAVLFFMSWMCFYFSVIRFLSRSLPWKWFGSHAVGGTNPRRTFAQSLYIPEL